MRLAGLQVLSSDVDNVTPDCLRRVEGESEVFMHLVDAQLSAFVDGSLIDLIRHGEVDKFTVIN